MSVLLCVIKYKSVTNEVFGLFCLNKTGMEVALYLSDKAASVALVGPSSYPFEKSLGPEIGKMTMEVSNFNKVVNILCKI